ncbi:MAG: hypothetical protein R2867_33490 [Caldilineaceae bacterium]
MLASGVEALQAINNLYVSPDGDLMMDESAGLFQYHNTDALGSESVISDVMSIQAAGLNDRLLIGDDTARSIADNFLQQNQLMPADAQFSTVVQDVLTSAEDTGRLPNQARRRGHNADFGRDCDQSPSGLSTGDQLHPNDSRRRRRGPRPIFSGRTRCEVKHLCAGHGSGDTRRRCSRLAMRIL